MSRSGWFKYGLRGLAMGPLEWDAWLIHRAVSGIGTHEDLLSEILLGRNSSDLRALKQEYFRCYRRDLVQVVADDLSCKTKRMFQMALVDKGPNGALVNPEAVEQHVQKLYTAGQKRLGTDEISFCSIILNQSNAHLAQVHQRYQQSHGKDLIKVIGSEFSGHMKEGLVHVLQGAVDRPRRDAILLEQAMAGLGTKDERLTYRLVRLHYEGQIPIVRDAYFRIYGQELSKRVKGETSGNYRKLLVALIDG